MNKLSILVDHVKARLGVSHRQIELSDEAIIKCLQQETLRTLSVYCPYFCQVVWNLKQNEVMPNMNTYFIPETLGDDFEVVGLEYVIPAGSGYSGNNMFFLPAGGDLQGIISSLAMTQLANGLAANAVNPSTFEFLEPNMMRLYSNWGSSNVMLVVRTTHKRDFSTFPFGLLETIKELAYYDVALDIYGIRKHFSNVQTLFAQIQLDMDTYNSIPDKRAELIEKLRTRQLRYSHTKKLFIV